MSFLKSSAAALLLALLPLAARAQSAALPEGVRVQKNLTFASVDNTDLKLDLYLPPASNTPVAVILRLAPAREAPSGVTADLLKSNFAIAYAGYLPGEPSNRAFSQFPADLQAAKAAVRYLRGNAEKFGLDKDRIAVWGAGHGASIAALLAVTADQSALSGTLGEFPSESSAVRALCLFEGITDWRNAELYGDESVNIPGSPAYQLFGGNPKEHSDEARQASAVNYITPASPPTLMVTLASDEQRAMHLIFAETLKKAGVRSALYEEPPGSSSRGIDEARLNRTVVEFFNDTLSANSSANPPQLPDAQIDQLASAGLYKQARRIIDEQMAAITGPVTGTLPQRAPWLKKIRQINDQQQEPALKQLLAAKKAGLGALADGTSRTAARTIWTIREILTDPERIGQYTVEATVPQQVFDSRANALRFVELLNSFILKGDFTSADRQATLLRDIARKGDADPAILTEFLSRYDEIRGRTSRVWPPNVHGAAYASDFGQDLYGYWMDIKSGGVTQRFRYIPPGHFTMGSGKDEWGRLPGEPLLEPVEIPRGFWLADSDVTQGLYEAVMGQDENHAAFRVSGNSAEVRLKLPIENVSYAHAVNFCNKFGVDARLPTEAEWEYACRAGSNFMYAGTGRLSDMAWFWDEARRDKNGNPANPAAPALDSNGEVDVRILHELETDPSNVTRLTHPVKEKLPNRWGLYDMQGNVWQWCSGTSPDKPRDYHPARGGSWISIPQSCRAARDVWFPIEQQSWNLGFRICITAN